MLSPLSVGWLVGLSVSKQDYIKLLVELPPNLAEGCGMGTNPYNFGADPDPGFLSSL